MWPGGEGKEGVKGCCRERIGEKAASARRPSWLCAVGCAMNGAMGKVLD